MVLGCSWASSTVMLAAWHPGIERSASARMLCRGVADRLGLSQRSGQVGERLDKIPVPFAELRSRRFVVCH